MTKQNQALIFAKVPEGWPVPGEHIKIEDIGFDDSSLPEDSISVELLYLSFDPYMRGRLRAPEKKSYFGPFELGKPLYNAGIARVVKSTTPHFSTDDVISAYLPFAQYAVINNVSKTMSSYTTGGTRKIDTVSGVSDLRHYLGSLGMPGQTAYSSLYEIGKPKKGETIFISSAAGAVGQLVGQLAKHEGLTVIGSVGSDEKLKFLTEEMNFDAGFNYKTEKPADALARLAPNGIDIYYENVGGEHLEAAIDAMNNHGRIVACGMISEYSTPLQDRYGIKNLMLIVGKRITMRGFIVSDPDLGGKWGQEHVEKLTAWLKDGSFKAKVHETDGITNAGEGFVGMLAGKNFGKAVLKV